MKRFVRRCVCVCRLAVDGVWRLCVHLPHEHRWQRTEQRACVCVCMCWAKMNDVFGLLFVFVGPNDGRYFCHVCGGVRLVFEYCYGWRLRRPNCVSVCVTDTSFSLSVFRVIGVSAIEIVVPLLVWDLNENEFHTHVNYAPTRRTCRYSFDFILCECMPPGSFMRRMRILWRRKLRRQNLTYACLGEYFYNFAGQIETKKNPIFTSQWKWYPFPRCERKTFDGISLTWNSIKNTFIQDDLHRTCAQCTNPTHEIHHIAQSPFVVLVPSIGTRTHVRNCIFSFAFRSRVSGFDSIIRTNVVAVAVTTATSHLLFWCCCFANVYSHRSIMATEQQQQTTISFISNVCAQTTEEGLVYLMTFAVC